MPLKYLNRYEKFYRVVCNPLTQIKAKYFIADVNFILDKLDEEHAFLGAKNPDKQCAKNTSMLHHSVELLPLQMFTDHFSHQYIWQKVFQQDTAFKKLLAIPDLFTVHNYEKFEFGKNQMFSGRPAPLTVGSSMREGGESEERRQS